MTVDEDARRGAPESIFAPALRSTSVGLLILVTL
ncbi:MAG: hypothetical protein QOC66_1687, partial [Pseudonocardiales bacterium]|nr:hypothetical protein [Pseudonocardiales bacterium]